MSKEHIFLRHPELEVKYTTLDEVEFDGWRQCLNIREMHKANSIIDSMERERYIKSKIFLRETLSEKLGVKPHRIEFSYDRYGKPRLCDDSLRFSLSHSGDFILVGIGLFEVGVDVEEERNIDYGTLICEILEPQDIFMYRQLDSSSRRIVFYTGWTLKESLIKAYGVQLENYRFKIGNILECIRDNWIQILGGHGYNWRHGDTSFSCYIGSLDI